MSQGDALRDRIIGTFESMPPQLQQAARHILEHPDEVALVSMRELARNAGVQPSTMTRLAKFLGFAGYEDIRAHHAQAIRLRVDGFAAQQERASTSDEGLAQQMLHSLSLQIARLGEPASIARLEAAAERLARARRIYVLGLRSCHLVAWHFHYVMTLLGERTEHLDGPAGTVGDGLMRAGAKDVLLAISINPYARHSLELAQLAREKGMGVVAITDSEVSPLNGVADEVILCATESPTFFHTLAPALAVSEVLCGLLANRDRAAALEALQKADRHLLALNTYSSAIPRRQ
ncbi:MurR/RpiR family transcriptional regulator [Paracoccus denitrificans]|jgi:DNA-binding MurR/RpiR family transcriptional regulator|nr:MurR/RpiR family transcriptional regulator [Paracoccus denitrificans]MCU7429093.1 MurR/RpiR family transcriptional regulator [Paracoccus denitrificans]QAR29181.1 MurR/RpiR family transcriptional regulator [Paracoccus denitrificans]UPV98135.1 MurR/RpiR family transcriptional regulator [Paracoccus denitrificans]WQO36538.1 MurR/RpiR family transcriptional regulator [Paracoccus denitrificans]SDJ43565.1 transcriptional regulator, RpiR family [Paracoccus denitrificans]